MKTYSVPVFVEVEAKSATEAQAFVFDLLSGHEFDSERPIEVLTGNVNEVRQAPYPPLNRISRALAEAARNTKALANAD